LGTGRQRYVSKELTHFIGRNLSEEEDLMDPREYELGSYGAGDVGPGRFPPAWPNLGMYYGPQMGGAAPGPAREHVGHGPKGYVRPDERVLEDVCERLTLDPMVDARGISVEVDNGEVVLTGEVENRQMKRLAEDLAFSVPGVKDVHVQVRIVPADEG
jgi:hypothetical protein